MRIVTDSTADFTKEEIQQYNIEVVPLIVNFEAEFFRDGIDITNEEFYLKLMKATKSPTTSQPSPNDYLKIFNDAREKEDEVIVITISSKISGTHQNCHLAKTMSGYDAIYIVDSLTATIAQKSLVLKAIKMRDEGASTAEIVKTLEERAGEGTLLAYLDTLDYLVMGGRVSKIAGMAGEILGVRPIVTIKDGEVIVLGKARGRDKALNFMYDWLQKNPIDSDWPICYGYTYPYETGVEIRDFFVGKGLPTADLTSIGVAIGTHGGPKAGGIGYVRAR